MKSRRLFEIPLPSYHPYPVTQQSIDTQQIELIYLWTKHSVHFSLPTSSTVWLHYWLASDATTYQPHGPIGSHWILLAILIVCGLPRLPVWILIWRHKQNFEKKEMVYGVLTPTRSTLSDRQTDRQFGLFVFDQLRKRKRQEADDQRHFRNM